MAPKKTVPRLVNLLEEELVALPCVLARKVSDLYPLSPLWSILVESQKAVPRLINLLEEELVALPCVLARRAASYGRMSHRLERFDVHLVDPAAQRRHWCRLEVGAAALARKTVACFCCAATPLWHTSGGGLSACETQAIPADGLCAQMRVVADEACAPELRPWALRKIAGNEAGAIDGWYKQQLIKLSCSFTVQVRRQHRRKPLL